MAEVWDEESPACALIKEFYREHGLENWTNDRVGRLCQKLKCSIFELCALAGCFQRGRVRLHWQRGTWPTELTVQFAVLENFIHERMFHTAQPPAPGEVMSAMILGRAKP